MVKLILSKKEIEKIIKDQFDNEKIEWDKEGNAIIVIDMESLKKRQSTPRYPIYIKPPNPYMGREYFLIKNNNTLHFRGGNTK